ncbi:MAG: CBS domain-containing protein [Planctomycetota bacterium]|nr:MAG: CBS domain-containing protein [Planctomycetota bacterium]
MKAKVRSIMCANPTSCAPDATIQQAAQLMEQCDCGAIPVVKTDGARQAVGVITDRDIACRAVARGMGPDTQVRECMSSPLATIGVDDSVEECCQQMERFKVRRLLVLDEEGELCGIVSQADIALHLSKNKTAEVVREISEPSTQSSLTE